METTSTPFDQLQTAKRNVIYLLDHADSSVDMQGLEYWASVVENKRKEIKELL